MAESRVAPELLEYLVQTLGDIVGGVDNIPDSIDLQKLARSIPANIWKKFMSEDSDVSLQAMDEIEEIIKGVVKKSGAPTASVVPGAAPTDPKVAALVQQEQAGATAVKKKAVSVGGSPKAQTVEQAVETAAATPATPGTPKKGAVGLLAATKGLGKKAKSVTKDFVAKTGFGRAAAATTQQADALDDVIKGTREATEYAAELTPEVRKAMAIEAWAPKATLSKAKRTAVEELNKEMHKALQRILSPEAYEKRFKGKQLKGLTKLLHAGAIDVPSADKLAAFVDANVDLGVEGLRGASKMATRTKLSAVLGDVKAVDALTDEVTIARRALRGITDKELQKGLDLVTDFMQKSGFPDHEISAIKKMGIDGIRKAGGAKRVAAALASRPQDSGIANLWDYVVHKASRGKKAWSTPVTSEEVVRVFAEGAASRPPLGGAAKVAALAPELRVGEQTAAALGEAGIRGMSATGKLGKVADVVRKGPIKSSLMKRGILGTLGRVAGPAIAVLELADIANNLLTAGPTADRIREMGLNSAGQPSSAPDILRQQLDAEDALMRRRAVMVKHEPELMQQIVQAIAHREPPPSNTTQSEMSIGSTLYPVQPSGTKGVSRLQMQQLMRQFLQELDTSA